MKITTIQADNVLAIKSINMKLATAVSLICGRNGSLKSSIFDVVSMAIAQEPMRAVLLKKDYGQLVHDGEKAGGGLVIMNGDPDQSYSFNLPKGEFIEPESPEFRVSDSMRVALNGQNFAKMDSKARLVFLRTLTKIRSSKEVILPMLAAAGAEAVKMEEVTAQLRGGFTAAEEYAKERALDAKRLWCSTTGKKSYGKDVAEAWEAPIPDVPVGDPVALRNQIAGAEKAISTATESLGAIKQAAAQATADAQAREKLAGSGAKVVNLREQIAGAEKDLADYLPKVEALRQRAAGKARVGLVHDMAIFISESDYIEPGNQASKLLERYDKEHGKLEDVSAVDTAAQAALPEHESGLKVIQNRVTNLKRDLDIAVQQKGQFDALASSGEAVDASAELAEVQGLLDQAKEDKQRLTNALLDIEACIKNRAEAEQKNVVAKKHHADVAQWLLIADELAPAGIPGRLLAAALEPVNAMLEQAQVDTGWYPVVIRDDMEIIVGGRNYNLQSESMRWRADAMIAQMVASISGIKIILLDRVDVLDMPGRAELFAWIDTLVEVGDIDSAMLFATLKDLPRSGLPNSFTAYWVEGGTVSQIAEPMEKAS